MATASRRLLARDHRYGDTTSSPMSKFECTQRGRPPASTSKVRPLGILVDINAQAGVDGKVLVASGHLFGLNLYPLPEAADHPPVECLFGDVGHDHNFGSVGKSQPLGTARVIRPAYLNHERAEEKE